MSKTLSGVNKVLFAMGYRLLIPVEIKNTGLHLFYKNKQLTEIQQIETQKNHKTPVL